MLKVYLAQAMTGRDRRTLIKEAKHAVNVFRQYGIEAWSPTLAEHVPNKAGKLGNSTLALPPKWRMDKQILKECFVAVNITGDLKSFGAETEYGLHRMCYWKPFVLVSKRHASGYFSVASLEDDAVVGSVEEAALLVKQRWGKHTQRAWFKCTVHCKSFVPWLIQQLKDYLQ